MKSDFMEGQAALMEAADSVKDVISISKKARRMGTIRQIITRFRNSGITAPFRRCKKSQTPRLTVKPGTPRNYQTRRRYGVHTC